MIRKSLLTDEIETLRRGDVGPVESLKKVRERVEQIEPNIHSLVAEDDRWGRLQLAAEKLESKFPVVSTRPPLYGVPVGVKDIFHVDGLPTQAGSGVPENVLANEESVVVRKLKKAGALILGKTVTAEFAYFEPGPTRNPHNTDHTPGGSSSGSAAAVAAGICPLALGTQTIGSVIRPAAFCGVVGMKPSYGRISLEGIIACSSSVDHVGFFTQDVDGAKIAAAILCDDWRPLPKPQNQPTLAVPEGPYLQQVGQQGLEAFEAQVSKLERAGYTVERLDALQDIAEINERHERLVAAEFALTHHEWYSNYPEGYAEASVKLLEQGREVSTVNVAKGRVGRVRLREEMNELMKNAGVDVLISPSAPGSAPKGIHSTGDPIVNLPWTHSGLPALNLPAGLTNEGLPLGIQCVAPFGDDEMLLEWAGNIEKNL
jgi:Asp-tRNA(Asn)/Glu-tRNA(Gln) amidotransferase A subunit family amidase